MATQTFGGTPSRIGKIAPGRGLVGRAMSHAKPVKVLSQKPKGKGR